MFQHIGTFLRGRLPSSASIVGLSATLEPGLATTSVCKSLGFYGDNFHLIRRSNERPNVQYTITVIDDSMAGDEFPFLLPYLSSGRKAAIHCQSIDTVFRCLAYLWRAQPVDSDKLRRVRMYHSLLDSDYNEETIRLLEDDPLCQVVVCTIAFSQGLNVWALLDSFSLHFGKSLNQNWQERGRVGRNPATSARGVTFVSKAEVLAAEKHIKGVILSLIASLPLEL